MGCPKQGREGQRVLGAGLVLLAFLAGCGSRSALERGFVGGGAAALAAGGTGALGVGGTGASGSGAAGNGGSGGAFDLPIDRGHAPDPRLEPPSFCTLDGWCGSNADFVAISGTSETDIWIAANRAGNLSDPDTPFNASGQQWTAILHWDGFEWSAVQLDAATMPPGAILFAITAAAPDDVWAVGSQGRVLEFDGSGWLGGPRWVPGGAPVMAIAKYGQDMWEVGQAPDFWWGPEGEQRIAPVIPSELGLSALSPFERGFWGVGFDIVGRFYDGLWTVEPNSGGLTAIWAAHADTAFAVGGAGTLARTGQDGAWVYEGAEYFSYAAYRAVWGRSAVDVWAVGASGVAAHFDGQTWRGGSSITSGTLNGVWGTADNVWAVGDGGTFLALGADGSWRSSHPTTGELRTLWGAAPDDVWAAGDNLVHWDGQSWSEVAAPEAELLALSGSSVSDVWAVGRGGAILHWDGSSWTNQPSPTGADITGVWSQSPVDVWAVDEASEILHFDGQAWSAEVWGIGPLLAIAGNDAHDMVVVSGLGPPGTGRVNGRSDLSGFGWEFEYFDSGSPAYTVVFGDGQNIWLGGGYGWGGFNAGGQYPELSRWDGYELIDGLEPNEITYNLSYNPIVAGCARSVSDVWVALPFLMHSDGSNWSYSSIGGSEHVRALFATSTDTWALTDSSQIVRKAAP